MKYFLLKANEKYFDSIVENGNVKIVETKTTDYYTIELDDSAIYSTGAYATILKCQLYILPDDWPFKTGKHIFVNNDVASLGFGICIPNFIKFQKTGPNDFRTADIEILGIFDTKEEVSLL